MLCNTYLCKACQCFIPIWGATPPRSTPWGPYKWPGSCIQCVNLWKQHIVSVFTLMHIPTIQYNTYIQLKSDKSIGLGMFWWSTCSFLCTNHKDMIAHTPVFSRVGEHSHHLDFHHASRGWQPYLSKFPMVRLEPGIFHLESNHLNPFTTAIFWHFDICPIFHVWGP